MHKRLVILGTRGVPAQHGGFETLAQELSLYLVQNGWRVTVYCHETWDRTSPYETMWGRVRRVHIPVKQQGWLGTLMFGYKSALHARNQSCMTLTLGYHNAVFSLLQRLRKKTNVFHMGGLVYQGANEGALVKFWLKANERFALWFGNHLIVDHPNMLEHFAKRTKKTKMSLLLNGADTVTKADAQIVRDLGLEPGKYSTVISLPNPSHSLLEIVQGFSQTQRAHTLVVLGAIDEHHPYHQSVLAAASQEVLFLGPIYDKTTVQALRHHSYLYAHGHQQGGTNPSLVEALGAANPVIAHDNPFNRWVTGDKAAVFFSDAQSCAQRFDELLARPDLPLAMRKAAQSRHRDMFRWETILPEYEKQLALLNPYHSASKNGNQ